MFKDRLEGTRLFARLRSLDMECPRCARIYAITGNTPATIYNRRTGIFTCVACDLTLALGVLMYRIQPGRAHLNPIPPDWSPTVKQAIALRQEISNAAVLVTGRISRAQTPRNVALRDLCRCTPLESGRVIRHPACPIHSAEALDPPAGPPAPKDGQPTATKSLPATPSEPEEEPGE